MEKEKLSDNTIKPGGDPTEMVAGDVENGGNDPEYETRFTFYLEMLGNEDVGKRWRAVESLARTGDLRAVEPLIEALDDEDWRVRQKVAWALGYLGDPRAVNPLRKLYRYEREGVREIIQEALDMIRENVARQ